MSAVWAIARNDLLVWRRSPLAIAAALVPPVVMALLVAVLSASVTVQPVALVVQDPGPLAVRFQRIIAEDTEAYALQVTDVHTAARELADQQVAGVVVIPPDFDASVAHDDAVVGLTLNNVDIDFSDDIRRTVDRSVAEFDAPQLGLLGELNGPSQGIVLPNVYRVAVAEHNTRQTTVDFVHYNLIPVLVLLVINVGVIGTGLLVARDFERGTARLLLVGPRPRAAIVGGRVLGGVLATGAVLLPVVVIAVASGVMQPDVGHWPLIAALLVATTLMAVAIGLLLGVALRKVPLVTMVAVTVATYLFLLGGGFTTIAYLPGWIQAVSYVVPTSYAIDGLRQTLFYPQVDAFATDVIALVVTAAVLMVLGVFALNRAWRSAR